MSTSSIIYIPVPHMVLLPMYPVCLSPINQVHPVIGPESIIQQQPNDSTCANPSVGRQIGHTDITKKKTNSPRASNNENISDQIMLIPPENSSINTDDDVLFIPEILIDDCDAVEFKPDDTLSVFEISIEDSDAGEFKPDDTLSVFEISIEDSDAVEFKPDHTFSVFEISSEDSDVIECESEDDVKLISVHDAHTNIDVDVDDELFNLACWLKGKNDNVKRE